MAKPKKITGSQIIGRALKMEGISNIFTIAGDHILPTLNELPDMDFRFVDTRHEQAAVHMADAWGRITGRLGVCMYTTPGFANALPGLVHALSSESPVLSISGSAELSQLGRGAMQEIEQVAMAAPVTKGAWMVPDARRIPDFFARAVKTALNGRRGPAHLTIPVDVQHQEVDEAEVTFYRPEEYRAEGFQYAGPDLIDRAIQLLRQAERPLIIAGSPAAYTHISEILIKFIEITNLPLMADELARGLLPEDHPNCPGPFDPSLNWAARLLGEADVVLFLGRKQDSSINYTFPPTVGGNARIIQVDPSPAEIGRNRGVTAGILGDIHGVVEQLTQLAAKYHWPRLPWLARLQEQRAAQGGWMESLEAPRTPMHPAYVHKVLQEFVGPDDFIVFEGGDFCSFGRARFLAHRGRHVLYLPHVGMLGAALPTAMAAKLAHPESRAVCITGDGAFGFNGMEIDTAVRHGLPVVTVLGNDSAWGIDRQMQLAFYGRPVVTDLLPTRYDKVAEGLGGHGEYVERAEDLRPALERAFTAAKPSLVNIMVQRAISPRAEVLIAQRKAAGWSGGSDNT